MNNVLQQLVQILRHAIVQKFFNAVAQSILDALIAWVEDQLRKRGGGDAGLAAA